MARPDPERSRRRAIRLSILASVLVVIAGGLYALFVFQSGQQELSTEETIAEARLAFDEADYARVLELLENPKSPSSTVTAIHDDAVLLKMYVEARKQTPTSTGQHVTRIIAPLKMIVRLDQEDTASRDELFELLLVFERYNEVERLAEQLLTKTPEDAKLWRALGAAQAEGGSRSEALAAYREAGRLEPLHVPTQAAIVHLLKTLNHDTADFVANAEATLAEHPEDPRAEVIQALARLAQNDPAQARTLLRSAAERPAPNEAFIATLTTWLDRVDLFTVAAAYLDRVADEGFDSFAAREAVYRAYDAGDLQSVLDRLTGTDPASAHPDLVAVWAMASSALENDEQTERLIDHLLTRADPLAQAWAQTLRHTLLEPTAPGVLIDQLTAVFNAEAESARAPELRQHPYLHQVLGEAYLQINEHEAAMRVMRIAAESRPSWARPHRLLAQTLLEQGQPTDALRHAEMAWSRQQHSSTAALRVEAMLRATHPRDRANVETALSQAEQLLKQWPDHLGVLPAMVTLLAETGQTDLAKQRIERVLVLDPPVSAQVLNTLLSLSERYQLDKTAAIHQVRAAHHGNEPGTIYEQAIALANQGKPNEGRALIERSMPEPPTLGWQLVLGRFLAVTNAEDASAYWIALADDYPEQLALQREVLQVTRNTAERSSIARVIDRLRKIGGETSTQWRIEQARLLMRDEPGQDDLRQALTLLREAELAAPNDLDTQVELARCLVLSADLPAAESHASRAKKLAPNQPGVPLLLGQILHTQGKFAAARVELEPIAVNRAVAPRIRTNAALILAEQGETGTAIQALTDLNASGALNKDMQLMLARLHASAKRYAEADALCEQLMRSPSLDVIAFVADYYAQTGRDELAQQARAAGASAGLNKADQLALSAQAAARAGQGDQAIKLAADAAQAEPANIDRWRSAAQMALLFGNPTEAINLAKQGLASAGDHPGLAGLIRHERLIRSIEKDPALTPLASAILNDASGRVAAATALRIANESDNAQSIAGKLAQLAQDHPDNQTLSEIAASRLLAAGMNRQAFIFCTTGTERFATSAALARTKTLAAYRIADWVALETAARIWAKRDPASGHLADLMLAAAHDATGRYDLVTKTLAPHISQFNGSIDANPQHFALYTRGLIRTGQADQAWALLQPQLSSPMARTITLQRIGEDLTDRAMAVAWLDRVSQASGTSSVERIDFARAAFFAGSRFNNAALIKRANQAITAAVAGPGPHPAEAYNLRGQIARTLGDLATAEASFRQLLTLVPDNPQVLNNLAMLLVDRGDAALSEAQTFAERAVELSPEDPNLLDTLALVLLRRGQLDAAAESIERAIRLDPGNAPWRLTQADILEAQGQTDRAETIRARYSASAAD